MLPVEKIDLIKVNLEELCKVFENDLKNKFEDFKVTVEECPDLTKSPFNLAASGLCGKTGVAVVGGVNNLVPIVKKEKTYSFEQIAQCVNMADNMLFIGAGAGPFHKIGTNCELMPNVLIHRETDGSFKISNDKTHFAKIDQSNDKGYVLNRCNYGQMALLGDMFVSEGLPGKVLKIEAKKRLSKLDFVGILREILKKNYPNDNISLGGVFMIEKGDAKLHIMPDFSEKPLTSEEEVGKWLKMFDMNSPLTCLTVMHSVNDSYKFRMEHTHCFSEHGQGGHYHFDITPQHVSYKAYLNVGQHVYWIDKA